MKSFCLLLLSAAALAAQPIGFGVKAGLPMNDFLDTARSGHITFDSNTNRYIIGPSVELRLPFGLGIEFDALYRHFGYNSSGADILGNSFDARTSSGAWEFPLVAKYRFKALPLIHPFVEAGVSWDHLSGVSQTLTSIVSNVARTSSTSNPPELHKDTVTGFVIGGGIDFKLLVIHVVPEVRYTRWGSKHFLDLNGLLNSNQNQGEFLVGFKF
ncbi:MAG TPA: outer membrane beta-barrel protein [Candidatus Acidoferrum sp.]|nr:outer membrane beta-barrel protein [Candidatus Acidoferrum sp.]